MHVRWVHSSGLDTEAKQRSFALCVGICNYGYIPLPLAMEFYPDAVIDLIMHNVGVDLALWSVGIAVIAGAGQGSWHRAIFSPPLIAVLGATLIKKVVSPESIPGVVQTALTMLGDCTIPMGLLLSGAIIIDFLRDANWTGAHTSGSRGHFDTPGAVSGLDAAGWSNTDQERNRTRSFGRLRRAIANMRIVLMLQAAMPAAIFPIVLVRMYDRDTTTALRVVLPTSIAAVVLIPVWLAIGKWWLGV